MDEQVLKDFIATAQANDYNYDVVMPKFPELSGIELQVLKDYIATAEANNYDYAVVNPKFPELFGDDISDIVSDTVKGVLGKKKKDSFKRHRRGYRYGICFHFGRRSSSLESQETEPTPELTPEQKREALFGSRAEEMTPQERREFVWFERT